MKHKLMVRICIILIGLICGESLALPLNKSDVITSSEVWSDVVTLLGDVTVPKGVTVTVMPGTKILSLGDSLYQKSKRNPEITVYGKMDILGEKDNWVVLGEKSADAASTSLSLDKTQTIVVSPYPINTEPLREEFKQFRIQYVILWTILSFSIYYAIRNRG